MCRYECCVAGWASIAVGNSSLSLQALEMALQKRDVRPGLIHHSDQGVQYADTTYATVCAA